MTSENKEERCSRCATKHTEDEGCIDQSWPQTPDSLSEIKIGDKIRAIPGYDGKYAIDENGKLYSFNRPNTIEIKSFEWGGYQRVALFKKYVRKSYYIHQLVALAFVENPESKKFVNHKDGNKWNNHKDNLEWCTMEENSKHSREVLGNTNLGTRNSNYGYRKYRFYPAEYIRRRLIEAGIPRYKHDIVSIGEMLPNGSHTWKYVNEKEEVKWAGKIPTEDNTFGAYDAEINGRALMLLFTLGKNHEPFINPQKYNSYVNKGDINPYSNE